MPALLKIQRKGQVTIPSDLRDKFGLSAGDLVEARAERGRIVLVPKTARDEYTPEQRKTIDAQLAAADEDKRKGRIYGPFTPTEAARFLNAELKKRRHNRK